MYRAVVTHASHLSSQEAETGECTLELHSMFQASWGYTEGLSE